MQGADRVERGHKCEMKIAIAYDGAKWTTGKKRRILDNKVSYASFDNAKDFTAYKEGVIANHYAMKDVELRVANGDGGSWIKSAQDMCDIRTLDAFHRNVALIRNVNDEDLRKTMFELLYSGEVDNLLACIEASIESTLDPQEQENRRNLLRYFTSNKNELTNYYNRGIKIPDTRDPEVHHARLGSMESNVYTIIGNRMKGRRYCWSIKGGNNLAALLALKYTTGYGHLFSRIKSGFEKKSQEIFETPLSASDIKKTTGRGYEPAMRGHIASTKLRQAC